MGEFIYKTVVGGIISSILLPIVLVAAPEVLLGYENAQSLGIESATSFEGFIGNLFLVYILLAFFLICTGGIGLVILIPVGYGVGWVVFEIVGWVRKKPESKPKSTTPLTRDQQALLNYIKKARTKGLNDEQISRNLTYNGWTTDSITAAFQMMGNG